MDIDLMECLANRKIHYSDMQMLNEYDRIIPVESGKIILNDEHTRILQLPTLEFDDEKKKYQTIIDIFQKGKKEFKTHSVSVSKIKLGLYLLERLGKAVGFLNSARFNFLKEPSRVFLEFDNYKNSFAIVMPMMDDLEE